MLDKLKNYCEQPLTHWEKQRAGSGDGKVLVIYGKFPSKSKTDFKIPKKIVPHQAQWGRFRLGANARLIGFVIPDEYNGKIHPETNVSLIVTPFMLFF